MIIDSRSEIEQGPDPVLRSNPRMRILDGINNPKCWPVSDRRIRMSQISLYSQYCLSLSKPSVQHLLPVRHVLLWTLRSIRTCSTTVDVDTEILRSASTDVRVS